MDTQVQATLSELRERVKTAHQRRRPLRLHGSGTKDFYGEDQPTSPQPDLVDLRPYSGIVDYEPSELFITARCGTPLAEIEATLARHNQFLAFEPVQRRIKRAGIHLQNFARVRADRQGDPVTVLRAPAQGLQDQEVQRPLQQFDAILIALFHFSPRV